MARNVDDIVILPDGTFRQLDLAVDVAPPRRAPAAVNGDGNDDDDDDDGDDDDDNDEHGAATFKRLKLQMAPEQTVIDLT